MRMLLRLLLGLVVLTYPFLVYFGLLHFDLFLVALAVMAIGLVRFLVFTQVKGKILNMGLLGSSLLLIFAGLALFLEQSVWLKVYPVAFSLMLLYVFGISLWTDKSMIQRFAELREKDITPHKQHYMRQLTVVWCGFFIFNALVSTYTLLWTSDKVWMLYNGLISYLLLGALVVTELLFRYTVVLKRKT